jgi:hypothetical protein
MMNPHCPGAGEAETAEMPEVARIHRSAPAPIRMNPFATEKLASRRAAEQR